MTDSGLASLAPESIADTGIEDSEKPFGTQEGIVADRVKGSS
jgi:hypothetical protein